MNDEQRRREEADRRAREQWERDYRAKQDELRRNNERLRALRRKK
jgi:hypothetical protein